ncbi:MAG: hypothetical protein WC911_04725 [Thermoleophilia bacterium]
MTEPAKARYLLKVLPAGKNDRVVEISDGEGRTLKYVYCPRGLEKTSEDYLDLLIKEDWENMDADQFTAKYALQEA